MPAREGVGSFEVEFVTFLDETFTVTPFVNSVPEVGVQDFHGIGDKDTAFRERGVGKLWRQIELMPAGFRPKKKIIHTRTELG